MRVKVNPTPEDQAAVEKAISVKVLGKMEETDPTKSKGDYYVCWIPEAEATVTIPARVVKERNAKEETKKRPKNAGTLPETAVLCDRVQPESAGGPHQEPRRGRGRPRKQPVPPVLGAPHGPT